MRDEQLFRVTFSGVITDEYDLKTTKKMIGRLFRISPEKVERLFSGKEYVLKDNVTEDVAMNFGIRIAESGCECYVETVPDSVEIAASDGDTERREGERRTRFRRPSRPGSATGDRRILIGRRTEDQPKLTEVSQQAMSGMAALPSHSSTS